jgi:RHS repeat-associated protein
MRFSDNPTDDELSRAHIFNEILTPIGVTTPLENQDLAHSLTSFLHRTNSDDFSSLTRFLETHPASPWRASLLTGLGAIYRHTGWFSKALACWDEAWNLAKGETKVPAKTVADVAVAETLELNARLGRYDRLQALFAEIEGRDLNPALSEKVRGARQGLWLMLNRPEDAFRCGPMALNKICGGKVSPELFDEKLFHSRSTTQGICLSSVCDLAGELGMKFQMARREPGAPVILPALVHWKLGHYAALLKAQNGQYLVDDPTFGDPIWVSQAALDAESSGYFLVPAGPLPAGWQPVTSEEGKAIWGKGTTKASDNSRTRPCDKKNCPNGNCNGMAQYAIHLMLVSLDIADIPVGYSPPRGPGVFFKVTYNQREAFQPTTFNYCNLGPKWTFDWLSYIEDDGGISSADVNCYLSGGGYEPYTSFDVTSQTFGIQWDSHTRLIRTSSTSYERDLPDGSKQIFSLPLSGSPKRKVFLTQVIDPAGNTLTFTYDGSYRLVAATDAIGQVSTVSYDTNDTLKIVQVMDPFGRHANFQYDKYDGTGQLTNITDTIGINSGFTYSTNAYIISLTTPYGTTTFTNGGDSQDPRNAWITATDPLGQTERVAFVNDGARMPGFNILTYEPTNVTPTSVNITNRYLIYRNTFFWDKQAMQLYPGDYAKARITHWFHMNNGDFNTCSGTVESSKEPLEARVWFTYPGQTGPRYIEGTNGSPSAVARVLDDGSNQTYFYEYNPFGKVTKATDPAGRATLFTYSTNLVDLLQVAQQLSPTNQVLAQFCYSTNHLPLTAADAAGQTNYLGYNPYGQLTSVTNALSQVTTLAYDTNGYLTNITGALPGATTGFTYDGYGRVRTVTDSAGYALTTDYDLADRPTKITYPDNTLTQVIYSNLDPVLTKDRRGHWSTTMYDALRRVTDTVDSLGRHIHFDWCGCGGLAGITDPLGRTTSWLHDLQGRVTAKVYADGTQIAYSYETNCSRLKSLTDARNQTTLYQYLVDNNLQQISYSNAVIATPSVSFTYDANYNRPLTMTDGIGLTTYSYYTVTNGQLGAGLLSSADGPLGNDTITYTYDALGRATNSAINGVAQTAAFDALGRVTTITNALGSFTNVYVGTTTRIATKFYPNGQRTVLTYYGATNDFRPQQIQNLTTSTQLSAFTYSYDADGQITNWTRQADASSPTVFNLGYDAADQLINAILATNTPGGAILKQFLYTYDAAGNPLSEHIHAGTNDPAAVTGGTFNNLNQLTALNPTNGPMTFAGWLDKPGSVTVNGTAAVMDHTTNFFGFASVSPGTNVVRVIAADRYGNRQTNSYQIVVTNSSVTAALTYDLNGNLTSSVAANSTNTYEWDAANRLRTIVSGTNRSEFTYDGEGRRVQIVEKQNGNVISTKKFLWCGAELCEERDSTGTNSTKRFFPAGQINGTTNLFYSYDHSGSIREMTDINQGIRVRYDYDTFGRMSKIQGDLDCDFGFTGFYRHQPTGLSLALFRAYDPDTGRWTARDPAGESVGPNLYAYANNNPPNETDALGLLVSSLDTPEGAGVMAWLAEQATVGASIAVAAESTKQISSYLGGDCDAIDPGKILREGAKGGALGIALAPVGWAAGKLFGPLFKAATETLAARWKVVTPLAKSSILEANRIIYEQFKKSGGELVVKRSTLALGKDGAQLYGEYNAVKNKIYLYMGSNLGTLSEELIHFVQVNNAGLVGKTIAPEVEAAFESQVKVILKQWGFAPK